MTAAGFAQAIGPIVGVFIALGVFVSLWDAS